MRCAVSFYRAGVVTHDHWIGSWFLNTDPESLRNVFLEKRLEKFHILLFFWDSAIKPIICTQNRALIFLQ
jgi:hypothetical protein